jgi:hypothetical protein
VALVSFKEAILVVDGIKKPLHYCKGFLVSGAGDKA